MKHYRRTAPAVNAKPATRPRVCLGTLHIGVYSDGKVGHMVSALNDRNEAAVREALRLVLALLP